MIKLYKMRKLKLLLFFILIFTFIAPYKSWLSFNILKGGEWLFYFSESLINKYSSGTWITNGSLGYFENVITYRFPLELILGMFGFFGLDSRYADFFVFYLPTIVGFPLASFLIGKHFFRLKLPAVILLMFSLSFNSYFLFINAAGHLHINLSSIFAIFAFYFYACAFVKKKGSLLVLSFLFLFISGVYDFRPTYITILLIFFTPHIIYFSILI